VIMMERELVQGLRRLFRTFSQYWIFTVWLCNLLRVGFRKTGYYDIEVIEGLTIVC
jgi:hypothetical protein